MKVIPVETFTSLYPAEESCFYPVVFGRERACPTLGSSPRLQAKPSDVTASRGASRRASPEAPAGRPAAPEDAGNRAPRLLVAQALRPGLSYVGASCPCAVAGPRKRSAQVRTVSQGSRVWKAVKPGSAASARPGVICGSRRAPSF